MQLSAPTPILRSFDATKAQEFYVDFLGFTIDWQHRFGDNFPLYMQVSRGACILHLSEHHGDCSPGSALRIRVDDVDALRDALQAKDYRYAKPGAEDMPWGTREMGVTDPFGNRLIFFSGTGRSDA